jgi:hypothetical protein
MSKLTIPQRQSNQDDATYAQIVQNSIREQRPYLSDDDILSLAQVKISTMPSVQPSAQPKAQAAPKVEVAKVEKPQPFKSTTEMVDLFVPKQQVVAPKTLAEVARELANKKVVTDPMESGIVARQETIKKLPEQPAIMPSLGDPNVAAGTVKMLEKFIPPQQPKEQVAPTEVGGFYNPYDANLPTQENFDPAQAQRVRQNLPQAQNVRESFIAQPQAPQVDVFDAEAERQLPNGSSTEKTVYAKVLRDNDDKIKTFEASKVAAQIPTDDFEATINKKDLSFGNTQRASLMKAKLGGDMTAIESSLNEYQETPEFKRDVIKAANGNKAKFKEAAQLVLDNKANEYAFAPTKLQKKMQQFSDWAATNDIPLDYAVTKTLGAGLKGFTDVGAFGAALIGGTSRSMGQVLDGRGELSMLDNFAAANAKAQKMSSGYIPQVQSEKASGLTQGLSDVTSIVAAIGAPMSVVKSVSIFGKAKNLLSLGTRGESAIAKGLSAEAQLAARATSGANKTLLEAAKVLQSKPANMVAQVLDGAATNWVIMGSSSFDAQRQKYLDMGFTEQQANRRAFGMTSLTNLLLAMPNVLRPHEASITQKIFSTGSKGEAVKAGLKQAAYFGGDMTLLRSIESTLDDNAKREQGIKIENTPFSELIKENGKKALVDAGAGFVMGLMARGKYKQSDMQLNGIVEAFKNPEQLSLDVQKDVANGRMTKEQAKTFQDFLTTIEPQYQKALNETIEKNGKQVPKYNPQIAVKIAIEKTKAQQAAEALKNLNASVETKTIYETDKKSGEIVKKTVYRHKDGKLYETEEASTKGRRISLLATKTNAEQRARRLEAGYNIENKLVAGWEMADLVDNNSLNGKAKEGQREAIMANAPYEAVEINVNDFANQPEIAELVSQIESGKLDLSNVEENNIAPPTIDAEGNVIDGKKVVANQIVKSAFERGGGTITFMKPITNEAYTEAANEAFESKVGDTAPITKGLTENEGKGVIGMAEVFDKVIENGGDAAEGLVEAAKEGLQAFVEPQVVAERLKDIKGEDTFSEPIIEAAVNKAVKAEPIEAETTKTDIEKENISLVPIEKPNPSFKQNRHKILKNNEEVGFIVTSDPKEGVVKILGVTVNEGKRGQGIAGDAYIKLNKLLAKSGAVLESDNFIDSMEPQAIRIWEKLLSQGLVEKLENTYRFNDAELKALEQPTSTNQSEIEATTPTEAKTIAQLRAEEKAEMAATDPNDKEALDEISNRYDKLITPLLEKEKAAAREKGVKDMSVAERMRQKAKEAEVVEEDVAEELPSYEDGTYQIYKTKTKSGGEVKEWYSVPSIKNKESKGAGDSLHKTLEDAIAKIEQNVKDEAQEKEKKKIEDEAKAKNEILAKEKSEKNKNKTSAQIMADAKAEKMLDVKVRYSDGIMSRREFLNKQAKDGGYSEAKEIIDNKGLKPKKIEYRIFSNDNSFVTVSKTEFDYFNSIKQKGEDKQIAKTAEAIVEPKKDVLIEKSLSDVQGGKTFYDVVKENDLTADQSKELAKQLAESLNLPKKQFLKKDKIINDFEPNENIDVKPVEKAVKQGKSKSESIGIAISKDDLRPNMQGVFNDAVNKKLVATDANKMIVISDPSIKETKIIDPKTGNVIDGRFPDYNAVIPKDNPIKRKVNVKEFLAQLNGLSETKKFFETPIAGKIKIGEQDFAFNSELMRDVFQVMAEQGVTEVELQLSQPNRAIVIESNKGVMGIVMPLLIDRFYRGGSKIVHQSEMTIAEKNNAVQKEIDALESRRKDINNNLKEAVSKFRNANADNRKALEFDMEYHKKRLAEIDAEIAEGKSKLIDNPIQEQEDLVTVKTNIENGEITSQDATEYVAKPTKRTRKTKQSIEALESKAESESETELNEVVAEADKLISEATEEKEQPKSKLEVASSFIRDAAEKFLEQHEKEINDPNAIQRQGGLSKKQIGIALKKLADIIDAVGDVEKAIKQFLDGIKDPKERTEYEKEINNFFLEEYGEKEEVKPVPFAEIPKARAKEVLVEGNKVVDKTLENRLMTGETADSIKQEVAKKGLERVVDDFATAEVNANNLVEKHGYNIALSMAIEGEIDGAARSAILGMEYLRRDDAVRIAKTASELRTATEDLAEWVSYIGYLQAKTGSGNAYWAKFYADNPDLGLTLKDKIDQWAATAGKATPIDIREKYEKIDAELKTALERVKELEAQKPSDEMMSVIKSIQEQTTKGGSKLSTSGKEFAAKIRKLKVKPIELKDADGNPILDDKGKPVVLQMQGLQINELIEIAAKAAEKSDSIIDGFNAIRENLETKEWFKKLTKKDKESIQKQIEDAFESSMNDESVEANPITNSVIRDYVKQGFNTPEALLEKLMEHYPNKSEREVRDMVSKYGQEITKTADEIDREIRLIKNVFKTKSQLEDIAQGIRPKKRILPVILTPAEKAAEEIRKAKERKMVKDVRQALDNMEVDLPTLDNELRNKLDKQEATLSNKIKDLELALESGKEITKNEKTKLTSEEIEKLELQLEDTRKIYNEVFGKKPMTEGERKLKSLQTELENLYKEKEEVEKAEPKYTVSEKMDIEALQNEIAARKKALRLEGSEMQTAEEKRVEKLQKELNAIGKEKPVTEKEVIDRSQREKEIIKKIEEAKAKLAETKKIVEIDTKIAETEKKIQEQNFEAQKSQSKEYSDAVQKKIDELKDVRKNLNEAKKEFEKNLKTDEERRIEVLEKRLDNLKFGERKPSKEKIARTEKELLLLDEIAKEKELQGLTKGKATEKDLLETKLIAKEKQIQKLRDKRDGIETIEPEKQKTFNAEIDKLDAEAQELRKQIREQKPKEQKVPYSLEAVDSAIDANEFKLKGAQADLEVVRKRGQDTSKIEADIERYKNNAKTLEGLKTEIESIEAKRVLQTFKNLAKRKEYYEQRKASGQYAKKPKNVLPLTTELTKALSEVDRLKFEEQKLLYLAEKQSMSGAAKVKDIFGGLWNVPRLALATGEWSFVGMQGRRLAASYLIKNPSVLKEAFKNAFKSWVSGEFAQEMENRIKNDPEYHIHKSAGVDYTEQSFKTAANEEIAYNNIGKIFWRFLNAPDVIAEKMYKLKTGKDLGLVEEIDKFNPLVKFERSASGFLNTLRYAAMSDMIAVFKQEGLSFEKNKQDYKSAANYINSATGRGGSGIEAFQKNAEVLSKFFFSPKMFMTELQLGTSPLGLAYIASMKDPSNIAKREAFKHQLRYMSVLLGAGVSATMLAYLKMGSTDENDDGTGVEFNPASADYGKIVFPNGRTVDFFNGAQRYIVLYDRLFGQKKFKNKEGIIKDVGVKGSPSKYDIIMNIPKNKINPALGFATGYLDAQSRKVGSEKYDDFGKVWDTEEEAKKLASPIFFQMVNNAYEQDPTILDGIGLFGAFFGKGFNVEEKKAPKPPKVRKRKSNYGFRYNP